MPDTIPIEVPVDFNINELTDGTVNGAGVFDVLMKSVKAHLREEFDANRIRATDYANVYTMTMGQVLAQSTQYATSRARLELELQATEAQIGKISADTVLVTKQCLLVEAQAVRESIQTTNIEANTRQLDYITNIQLPSQVASTDAQTALTIKQQAKLTQENLNLAAQKEQMDKQSLDIVAGTLLKGVELDMQTFNRDFKQPQELILMNKEVAIKESQLLITAKELLVKQAQVDTANKDIQLKESQLSLSIKELLIKQTQVDIANEEILIKKAQLLVTKYELTNKLPAEVSLVNSQSDLYSQKSITEKAQVDSTVIGVGSVTDLNNKLITEQSKTFLRSAQQTAAKLLIDTWNVRHTADPDGNLEDNNNKLEDATIGRAVQAVMGGIDIIIP